MSQCGANFVGMVSLITFLLTRHRDVLRVDPVLWDGVDGLGIKRKENGKDDKGDEIPPTVFFKPSDFQVRFHFLRRGRGSSELTSKWNEEPLSLKMLISILLTNRKEPGCAEKFLNQTELSEVKKAVNEFRWTHYESAHKSQDNFCDVDHYGRHLEHDVSKIKKLFPDYINDLSNPDYVPVKREPKPGPKTDTTSTANEPEPPSASARSETAIVDKDTSTTGQVRHFVYGVQIIQDGTLYYLEVNFLTFMFGLSYKPAEER